MVMRPQARCAIVAAAGGERGLVKASTIARLGRERDWVPSPDPLVVADPEIGLAVRAEAVSGAAGFGLLGRDVMIKPMPSGASAAS